MSVTNEVIAGTAKFFKAHFPGMRIYDEYTEQGFERPAVVLQGTTIYTHPRIGRGRKLVNCLMTAKIYGTSHRELRDYSDEVLLEMDMLELPTLGKVWVKGLDCPYLSEKSATITYTCTLDLFVGEPDKTPKMEHLILNERLKQQ